MSLPGFLRLHISLRVVASFPESPESLSITYREDKWLYVLHTGENLAEFLLYKIGAVCYRGLHGVKVCIWLSPRIPYVSAYYVTDA